MIIKIKYINFASKAAAKAKTQGGRSFILILTL